MYSGSLVVHGIRSNTCQGASEFIARKFRRRKFRRGKFRRRKFCGADISPYGNFAVQYVRRTDALPYGSFVVWVVELQLIRCLY